jgi:hypothetical protein
VATTAAILLLAVGAVAQTVIKRAPTNHAAPSADTFQVVCTMGNASGVGGEIDPGTCALDAEHDGSQGADPTQDSDGPSGDTVNNGDGDNNNISNDQNATSTSSCGQGSAQQVANCYPSPSGPATGNPRQGGGQATSGSVSSAKWLTACTKTFTTAEAACSKTPNPQACLTSAKNANKTCIMAASANAAQHGNLLPPDAASSGASSQTLSQADCVSVHAKNVSYCNTMTPGVKAACLTKVTVSDQLCAAAARG